MKRHSRFPFVPLMPVIFLFVLPFSVTGTSSVPGDTVLLPVKQLRIAIHVFQNDDGYGNFNPDSAGHAEFLTSLAGWVNHRLASLDTLRPAVSSPFVADARVMIRTDTVFYHRDRHAWDCSVEIDAPYMRDFYVDGDSTLGYLDKYQTLPLFIGGNNPVAGGHSRNLADRGYVAVRGYYETFMAKPLAEAIDECGRNFVHELCHCLGLSHNFTGGPAGDQCDECDDNGCPAEGTSNNIMDYWPSYGYGLSRCQFNLIHFCLDGGRGNISEIVINDSCYWVAGDGYQVSGGDLLEIAGLTYQHGDLVVRKGGALRVTGYLSMPGGSRIVLEPGSRLEIDGGTAGNLCGDLWQGIVAIRSDAEVPARISVTNGGTVENARLGVSAQSGTVTDFSGGLFRNCEESIVFTADSTSRISVADCSFVITTKLNRYEEGVVPVSFIRTTGAGSLAVSGCSFTNEPGTLVFDADWMGSGIISDSPLVRVTDCGFMNLTSGADVSSEKPDSFFEFFNNSLIHNRFGVRSLFAGIQRFAGNEVILQRFNQGATVGFCLNFPARFSVADNRFASVYGGGKMAAIVLNSPSADNSPLFGNSFANLPVGLFIDNPPVVDSALMAWSHNTSLMPRLGPQLRFSRFDRVPLQLAFVTDSVYGSAFGTPAEMKKVFSGSASSWRPGSFAWYSWDIPLAAFAGWKDQSVNAADHGLYAFMNFPFMGDSATVTDALPVARILSGYLQELRSMEDSGAWLGGRDLYSVLEGLVLCPAALRSPRLSGVWRGLGGEQKEWLAESFASIASRFTLGDTLLAALGTDMARLNVYDWVAPESAVEPRRKPVSPELMPQFTFPDLSAFRFLRSPVQAPDLPAFSVYPNPAREYITVKPVREISFRIPWEGSIISAGGSVMRRFTISSWEGQKISLSGMPAGIWFIELFAGNEYLGTLKFVKISPL